MLPGEERKWEMWLLDERRGWAALHKLTVTSLVDDRHKHTSSCFIEVNRMRH
jgi:hypothetical protein